MEANKFVQIALINHGMTGPLIYALDKAGQLWKAELQYDGSVERWDLVQAPRFGEARPAVDEQAEGLANQAELQRAEVWEEVEAEPEPD